MTCDTACLGHTGTVGAFFIAVTIEYIHFLHACFPRTVTEPNLLRQARLRKVPLT